MHETDYRTDIEAWNIGVFIRATDLDSPGSVLHNSIVIVQKYSNHAVSRTAQHHPEHIIHQSSTFDFLSTPWTL